MWELIAGIGGALFSSSANSRAAATAAEAERERARLQAEANARAQAELERRTAEATAAIQQANEVSQEAYRQIQETNAPGGTYLRGVVADPGKLTPTQQAQLDELRRSVDNQIRGSQFAGSGRTARSLFRSAETDFANDALEKNKQRAVDAANVMAGRSNAAEMAGAGQTMQVGTNVANLTAGLGNNSANLISNTGKVAGDSAAKSGLYEAQADAANGKLYGQAIGDISSIISNQSRESRYGDRLTNIEKRLGL
jgi:hypothetical protein